MSVVFSAHFEVGLAVTADGADFRGLRADDEVAADAAFPHAFAGLFEDLLHLNVLEELEVAFLVGAFDGADGAELGGEFGKAFLFGVLGELDVHVGPFVVFAFSGGLEVGGRGLDAAEGGEPQAGVFLFVAGRRQEDFGELLVAFTLGDFGEVRVLVAGLAFACEGGLEVLFGLGAGEGLLAGSGGLFLNLFEDLDALVAERADVVGGQFVAFVDVAADFATVRHFLFS